MAESEEVRSSAEVRSQLAFDEQEVALTEVGSAHWAAGVISAGLAVWVMVGVAGLVAGGASRAGSSSMAVMRSAQTQRRCPRIWER